LTCEGEGAQTLRRIAPFGQPSLARAIVGIVINDQNRATSHGRFQVALPGSVVGAVDGVEVLVLDVLDSRVRERELVDHHAHGVAEALVIGALQHRLKLRKCTGATNASASAPATFCCWARTSFG
jgi:hypothetical protein